MNENKKMFPYLLLKNYAENFKDEAVKDIEDNESGSEESMTDKVKTMYKYGTHNNNNDKLKTTLKVPPEENKNDTDNYNKGASNDNKGKIGQVKIKAQGFFLGMVHEDDATIDDEEYIAIDDKEIHTTPQKETSKAAAAITPEQYARINANKARAYKIRYERMKRDSLKLVEAKRKLDMNDIGMRKETKLKVTKKGNWCHNRSEAKGVLCGCDCKKAEYEQACPNCNKWVSKLDCIRKPDNGYWVHTVCPKTNERTTDSGQQKN